MSVLELEPMLDAKQLASVLGVHPNWIFEQVRIGELPSYKLGHHRRFKRDEVEKFLAERRAA